MSAPQKVTRAAVVAWIDRIEGGLQQTAAGISTALEQLRDLRAMLQAGGGGSKPADRQPAAAALPASPAAEQRPKADAAPPEAWLTHYTRGRRECVRLARGFRGRGGMSVRVVRNEGRPVLRRLGEEMSQDPGGDYWTLEKQQERRQGR